MNKKNRNYLEFLKERGWNILKVDNDKISVINLVGAPSIFSLKTLKKEIKRRG